MIRRRRRAGRLRSVLVALGVLSVLVAAGCRQTEASGGKGLEGTAITFSMKVDESERPAMQELLSRFQQRTRARVNLEQLSRFRDPLAPRSASSPRWTHTRWWSG